MTIIILLYIIWQISVGDETMSDFQSKIEREIGKIDRKMDRINSKKYPPIIYETYIEYKLSKLSERRAVACAELERLSQGKSQERVK